MSGPIKQHDRSLGGKKNTAQRAEKKADLSCIFMS